MTEIDTLGPHSRVTVKTCARALDCSERQVRRLIADGRLRASKLGPRFLRVEWASVVDLLESGKIEGAA